MRITSRCGIFLLPFLALFLSGCLLDFSPDGRSIVFTHGGAKLGIINIDGTGYHELSGGEGGFAAAWSPDGRNIAFIRETVGAKEAAASTTESAPDKLEKKEVVVYDVEAKTSRVLADAGSAVATIAWNPDSQSFAMMRIRRDAQPPSERIDVVWYNLADGAIRRRVIVPMADKYFTCGKIAWIPNTDDVAFIGSQGSKNNIYRTRGENLKQITTTNDVIGLGVASDGKKLLWARPIARPKRELVLVYSYNLASAAVTRLNSPLLPASSGTVPIRVVYADFSQNGAALAMGAACDEPVRDKTSEERQRFNVCYTAKVGEATSKLVHRTKSFEVVADPLGPDPALLPVWSKNGETLAVHELAAGADDGSITLYNKDGSRKTLWPAKRPKP